MFSQNIYSDQFEINDENDRKSVELLNDNEKRNRNETEQNINELEDLLRKSRRLKNSKTKRFIDEQRDEIPSNLRFSIESLVLTCNQVGRTKSIQWKLIPKDLQSLDLSGNFLNDLDQIDIKFNQLKSFSLSFNEIRHFSSYFYFPNITLLDMSYNLINDLNDLIRSLKMLKQLRILYLHGNPISLIIDYRLFIIDSLEKLMILDDIPITTEERFRCRNTTRSNEHPKDYSSITIRLSNIDNVPSPTMVLNNTENEWPLRIHRYQIRFKWFDNEREIVEIPFDKFSDYQRFQSKEIQSSYTEYKNPLEFSPNEIELNLKQLIALRDFIFHGTTCSLIHQITDYWPPGEQTTIVDPKKKSRNNSDGKDKKNETTMKKKKNEDLSKLIIRTDPIENVLFEFPVDLRPFLDGDYQISRSFEILLQDPTNSNQPLLTNKIDKKISKKSETGLIEQQRANSSKSNKDKAKEINSFRPISEKKPNKDEKLNNEDTSLIETTKFTVQFNLHRFISADEII